MREVKLAENTRVFTSVNHSLNHSICTMTKPGDMSLKLCIISIAGELIHILTILAVRNSYL